MSEREDIRSAEPAESSVASDATRDVASDVANDAVEKAADKEGNEAADKATEEVATSDPKKTGAESGHRFPGALDIVAMLLLMFVSQLVVGVICSVCGVAIPTASDIAPSDFETTMSIDILKGERFAIIYPLSMLAAFISIWLYVRLRDGKGRIARFSSKGLNPNIILSGFVWLIAAQIVIEPLLEMLPPSENLGTGRGFWASITAIVFAPLFEELICRGVVLETMRRRWGKITSVVLSSLFFGVIHLEPSVVISAFVAGAIFGTTYLRTESLFSTMILHALNNTFAFALIVFGLSEVSFAELFGNGPAYYTLYASALAICAVFSIDAYRKVYRTN